MVDRSQSNRQWGGIWKRRALLTKLVISLVSLAALFGPFFLEYTKNAADPLRFSDDSRQMIWPFLQYHDASLFRDDYVAQYYLDCMPLGYKLIYRIWSMLRDPRVLSKVLPFLLLPVVLVSIGVAAKKLGGLAAAWGATALCLSSSYFLSHLGGGLPHSFAIPVIAGAAMALVLGNPILLAVFACLGAAFYPVAGFVTGLTLAGYLLLLPRSDRGKAQDWSLRRRITIVGVTAVLSVLLILPGLRGSGSYGPLIRPDQVSTYPEAGPGGRFKPGDRPPYPQFGAEAGGLIRETLVSDGAPWPLATSWIRGEAGAYGVYIQSLLIVLVYLGSVGGIVLAIRDSGARRLLLLLLTAIVAHAAAIALAPTLYVPARYIDYPVPVLAVILLPAGASALGRLLATRLNRKWLEPAVCLLICVVSLLGLGSRGDAISGLQIKVHPEQKVYPFLTSLPADAMIAGWPQGTLDNVSYLCGKRVLITFEVHQAFHSRYLSKMRRRMDALVDAYYATDPAPLIHLRHEFGVTHLVIDIRHYWQRPMYFAPYNSHITRAYERSRQAPLETARQFDWAGVFSDGPIRILDLGLLRTSPPPPR